ncbi:MAG: hypothetical protein A3J46_00170 [Candidatus Yanofskybacteria bacterium RIFCSPHIGHO2_02_FULL_41_11]|uniref:VanZ-like domain-containing protein n=1 Tax=Candidatus Yanofskybacteria bacterium RIFCSPHIGHO2_02_FULL_41_11 TaxID=1802675 RepID=A0A1F8F7D0_9BACT|nr:MAG: hypothetical protein UW86_C0007G0004 [Microgenomates group bacterium GW2011_GWA1_Microgenomates_45_10]OGN09025.1 MAG: hypothetical protein A3J46_00170 [Candidatus Yanofskybacteria bacterium RIFCSPHIGHO2_02_FULL_41_11]
MINKRYLRPLICGLIVIIIGSVLATNFHIYSSIVHFDKVLHVSGGLVAAWFFGVIWGSKLSGFSNFEKFLILISLAALIGWVWELMEFIVSASWLAEFPTLHRYIYGGNLIDTIGDLPADIFGASLFALFYISRD